jgi:hypothetical protein
MSALRQSRENTPTAASAASALRPYTASSSAPLNRAFEGNRSPSSGRAVHQQCDGPMRGFARHAISSSFVGWQVADECEQRLGLDSG